MIRWLLTLALILSPAMAAAQQDFFMPRAQFERFRNRRGPKGEGSCVYASIAMAGAHHGVPSAEYLLVPSPYGPALMDGSWPERVEREFAQRDLPIWNISGSQTLQWIDWGLDRGAYVAITYGVAHMITAVGRDRQSGHYYIVDNNFPGEIRRVTREVFGREHRRYGGGWCVILRTPGPPPWTKAAMQRAPPPAPPPAPGGEVLPGVLAVIVAGVVLVLLLVPAANPQPKPESPLAEPTEPKPEATPEPEPEPESEPAPDTQPDKEPGHE